MLWMTNKRNLIFCCCIFYTNFRVGRNLFKRTVLYCKQSTCSSRGRNPHHWSTVGDHNAVVSSETHRILSENVIFSSETPNFMGDPQIFIGNFKIFIGDPKALHWRPQNFSLRPEMGITENTAMVVSNEKGFPTVLQWWQFLHNLILIDYVNCVENIASNNFILCFFSIHLQVTLHINAIKKNQLSKIKY